MNKRFKLLAFLSTIWAFLLVSGCGGKRYGSVVVPGPIQLNVSTQVSGQLGVANGGTGASSLTAHAMLVGEGASQVAAVGPGTANLPFLSGGSGADPSVGALPLGSISQGGASNNQVIQWNGSTWVPATVGGGGSSVTGTGFWYSASGALNAAAVAFSGDATIGALSGSNVPLTLATVNSNTGSFGDASHTVTLTLNGKGLTTAASSNSISIANANLQSGSYSNITGVGTLGSLPVVTGGYFGSLTSIASGNTTLSQAIVQRVTISTSGGSSATCTFPASPNNGDAIWVHTTGTSVTSVAQIAPNGNNIETPLTPGNTSSSTINLGTNPGVSALFIYETSGTLWRLWQ